MKTTIKLFLIACCICFTILGIAGCANTYEVTFDNGVTIQRVKIGEKAIEPYLNYDSELFTFEGWYLNEEFSGNTYDFDNNVNANLALYAKLTPKTYKVTYNLGWVEAPQAPIQEAMKQDGTFTLANVPLREGYTFIGWSDGKLIKQPGEIYTVNAKTSVTLTALWETTKITVRFLDWNDSVLKEEVISFGGTVAAPSIPDTKVGHFFAQWQGDLTNITTLEVGKVTYDIIACYAPEVANEGYFLYLVNDTKDGWIVKTVIDYSSPQYQELMENVPSTFEFPEEYMGLPCTEVAYGAMTGLSGGANNVTSVIVPYSYKKINGMGIYGYNITEVVLNDGLERIEKDAFSLLMELEEINLPSTITYVSQYAFPYSLKAINMEQNNTKYGTIDGVLYAGGTLYQDGVSVPSFLNRFGAPFTLVKYPEAKEIDTFVMPAVFFLETSSIVRLTNTRKIDMSQSRVREIRQGLFFGCNIEEVIFFDGTYMIGDYAALDLDNTFEYKCGCFESTG